MDEFMNLKYQLSENSIENLSTSDFGPLQGIY